MKKLATLILLTGIATGCVTTPELPDCEARVSSLLKDQIFPTKQCLGIVDQKVIQSSEKIEASMMLVILCGRTVELVGLINPKDEALVKGIKDTPNTQSFGQCKHKEKAYEILNSSIPVKEQEA